MNAVLRNIASLMPMTVGDLDAVTSIEGAAYPFPWSRGNFIDSLAAGYTARLLVDESRRTVGYFVVMGGVDEMHLLNITVAPAEQRCGHGRRMLDEIVAMCRAHGAHKLWLEVRESNVRARALYLRYGFMHMGVRRGYYPAVDGQREDATVMSLGVDGTSP